MGNPDGKSSPAERDPPALWAALREPAAFPCFPNDRIKGETSMKKIWKLIIGGIETKIFNLILLTVILLTGAFAIVTASQSRMLAALTADTSVRQQQATSGIISETMSTVAVKTMERTTDTEARFVDEMFQGIRGHVLLVADYAAKLIADPDSFQAKPYAGPQKELDGQLTAQLIWADGTDPDDPALQARAGLASNLSDLMISLCETSGLDNIYIGFPEGFFLMVNRTSGDWFREDGSQISYDPRTRFWYKQAVEAKRLVFSDLEVDANTGDLCVTCAVPVFGPQGEVAAVVASDLFLHTMDITVKGLAVDGGYCWIVNREGHVIYSPNPEVMQVEESANAIDLRSSENRELAELISDAMADRTDVRTVSVNGEAYYMQGISIPTVNWTLFNAISRNTVDQVENTLLDSYAEITDEARTTYQENVHQRGVSSMILLGLLALAAAAAALIVGKRIVKPLNSITRKITSLDEQNPEFKMEDAFRTGDEIEVLAESFAELSHKTIGYVDEVRRVTAEKERIGTELHMAKRIQEGMLPGIFPPFPDRVEFDLFASMDPAKEVGGDFYDFFLIDEDHLALVMADVSGKGVPGALFMMASKIILQSYAMQGGSPAEILARTNQIICANNPMQMFVTVWLGILEISTGRLTAANAGHEYPALYQRSDGQFSLFKDRHGFVIGGLEDVRYREYAIDLQPGDKIFVYTDGVPEATAGNKELFGTERMIDALNQGVDDMPRNILLRIRKAVDAFVGDAEQFDDLTMLCLEYKGPDSNKPAPVPIPEKSD